MSARSEDLIKLSAYTLFFFLLEYEITRSVSGLKLQESRAEDVLTESCLVQKI